MLCKPLLVLLTERTNVRGWPKLLKTLTRSLGDYTFGHPYLEVISTGPTLWEGGKCPGQVTKVTREREPWLQPGGTSFLKQQAKELVKEPTKKVPER